MAQTPSVDTLFCSAIGIASEPERDAYLAQACGGDEALRASVARLVAAHFRAGGFLESPVATPEFAAGPTLDEPARERPGTAIGPYKLLEQIGEGGMGAVWMAQQAEPVKRMVAIKLIKAGMDSKPVIARFEAERQALALMDHPNIAKVHDAGRTPAGRPYFVMELVKGQPITKYCDEKRLGIRERLRLFGDVCRAVQHAHQKGIIHRDLKPSNVLVAPYDGKPVVKVIDFGVAKATGQRLTDKTLFTGFGALVGTPEYLSPEQAEVNNQDIDTRSDIFSLGVLLYELLTGSTPLTRKRVKEAALLELLRVVREEEAPRPSTRLSSTNELPSISAQRQTEPAKLTRLVRGELDWIVMKALEKDRNRRYETANGFAADVERYLADEPVLACPPSAAYRLRKFARRHKGRLAAAGLGLLLLAAAGGGLGWLARDRAARQRDAEGKILEALHAAEPGLRAGSPWDPALVSAAQYIAAQLDSGVVGPKVHDQVEQFQRDVRMLRELDEIWLRKAEFNGKDMFDVGGTDTRLLESFRRYGIELGASDPIEAANRVQNSAIHEALLAGLDGWAQIKLEKGADRAWLRAVVDAADDSAWRRAFREAALAKDSQKLKELAGKPDATEQPPTVINWLGLVMRDTGMTNESIAVLKRAQLRHPDNFWLNYNLGQVLTWGRGPKGAAEAVGYLRAAVAIRPTSAEAGSLLGLALEQAGDIDVAIGVYKQAIAIEPKYTNSYGNLARAQLALGKFDESLAVCSKIIELDRNYFWAWFHRGVAYRGLGQYDKSLADFNQAVTLSPSNISAWQERGNTYAALRQYDKAVADYSKVLELDPKLAWALITRGGYYRELGQNEKALADYSKAIELDGTNAAAWITRGDTLGWLRRSDLALPDFTKAIEIDPRNAWARASRANTLLVLGRYDEALADCDKAVELDPKYAWGWACRGNVLRAMGRYDKALADGSRAVELDPKFSLAWISRGQAHAALRQYDKAVADLSRAIESRPWVPGARIARGSAFYALQQYDKAISDCSEAINQNPKDIRAWSLRIRCYRALHQHEKALADCAKVVELDAKNVDALFARAAVHADLHQYDKSLADYAKAAELEPKNFTALNNLAWLLATCPEAKLRDPGRAVALAAKAAELSPKEGNFWNTLGAARYSAGDWKEAVAALEKSTALRNGGDSSDWYFLAMARWQLGDKEDARRWYDKAVRWQEKNQPGNEELTRFRGEAEDLLKIEKKVKAK